MLLQLKLKYTCYKLELYSFLNSSLCATPPSPPTMVYLGVKLKSSVLAKYSQEDKSYDFENLHVVLSNKEKKIRIMKKTLSSPPPTSPTMIYFRVKLTYPPESVRRSKAMILKPFLKIHKLFFTPHYSTFGGELYFSPRRGCPRGMEFLKRPSVTKILRLNFCKEKSDTPTMIQLTVNSIFFNPRSPVLTSQSQTLCFSLSILQPPIHFSLCVLQLLALQQRLEFDIEENLLVSIILAEYYHIPFSMKTSGLFCTIHPSFILGFFLLFKACVKYQVKSQVEIFPSCMTVHNFTHVY